MENVLIVGSSSIVGQEISSLFKRSSMKVITTYAKERPYTPPDSKSELHLDLNENESIKYFAKNIKKILPSIDIAIFLSGILPGIELDAYDFAKIDEVMSVNFNGQAKLISKLLPLFNGDSRLLLFSSISAQRGSFDPIYAGSKGALLSLVKSLAKALPSGARVNAIAPGLIQDSKMFHDMNIERQEYHRSQVPSKKLLEARDLAKIVFDLCQDHWMHLNGACIDLNGGQNVR